ncbi:MAG: flagellar export protein FliJ [Pseudomonadota bacterium]|nr:flagellar export protein FliJ [Pseudomonadota bacterium]
MLAALRRRQELDAATQLARLGEIELHQGDLLQQLREFDQDYRDGLGAALQNGVGGQRLMELRRMQGQTNQACDQQQRRVADAQDQTERGRRAWQTANQRRRVFEELAQGLRRREGQRIARREQDELDDLSQH